MNPSNNDCVGRITLLFEGQIQESIDAAQAAFGPWRSLLIEQRVNVLMRWHDLILEHKVDLANLIVLEEGKPLKEALGEVDYGASFIRWFAEEAHRTYGETIPSHISNAQLATIREPIGVAALITPWNFPLAMITRKAAALAIGCTVIIKPAEETPLSALAIAELADLAGFPVGVFNVVTGNAPMVSRVFCESQTVKAISFTGSTRVGKIILSQSAQTVKKCSMELGGNAPFIVLPDMDIDIAASSAVAAKFQGSGQDCLAANRIFVARDKYEDFLTRFNFHMSKLKIGNGFEKNVDLGPLISSGAVDKANAIVDDALSKGARKIGGGDQAKSTGPNYFIPTLLADITPDMKVFKEENFCPVAGVLAYDDIKEVIQMANDTEYGLAAYVYGYDVRNIFELIRGLDFGMVSVNSVKLTVGPVPLGGVKQSGLGREGSKYGFDEYSEIKYYCLGSLPSVSGS